MLLIDDTQAKQNGKGVDSLGLPKRELLGSLDSRIFYIIQLVRKIKRYTHLIGSVGIVYRRSKGGKRGDERRTAKRELLGLKGPKFLGMIEKRAASTILPSVWKCLNQQSLRYASLVGPITVRLSMIEKARTPQKNDINAPIGMNQMFVKGESSQAAKGAENWTVGY